MTWDWKKLLQGQDPPLEEPSSQVSQAGERPLAGTAAEAGQHATDPQAGKSAPQGRDDASAGTEHAAGLLWQTTGTTDGAGQAASKGRLPELLYGELQDCAYCKGTGLMRSTDKCPVCRGAGQVKVKPPVVVCRYCHGRGHFPFGSQTTCPVCKGKGFNPVKAPIEICPDCRGRGKQPGHALYCGLCRGAGVVTRPQAGPNAARDARLRVVKMPGVGLRPPRLHYNAHDDFNRADQSDDAPPSHEQKQGLQWKAAPRANQRAARTG